MMYGQHGQVAPQTPFGIDLAQLQALAASIMQPQQQAGEQGIMDLQHAYQTLPQMPVPQQPSPLAQMGATLFGGLASGLTQNPAWLQTVQAELGRRAEEQRQAQAYNFQTQQQAHLAIPEKRAAMRGQVAQGTSEITGKLASGAMDAQAKTAEAERESKDKVFQTILQQTMEGHRELDLEGLRHINDMLEITARGKNEKEVARIAHGVADAIEGLPPNARPEYYRRVQMVRDRYQTISNAIENGAILGELSPAAEQRGKDAFAEYEAAEKAIRDEIMHRSEPVHQAATKITPAETDAYKAVEKLLRRGP